MNGTNDFITKGFRNKKSVRFNITKSTQKISVMLLKTENYIRFSGTVNYPFKSGKNN